MCLIIFVVIIFVVMFLMKMIKGKKCEEISQQKQQNVKFNNNNIMYTIYNNLCYKNKEQLKGYITKKNINYSKLNLKNKPKTYFDTVLIFENRFDNNFRHFMTETFYLLSFLFKKNFDKNYNVNNFKILINKKYAKHSYEILEILDLKKYIYFMEKDHIYLSKKIIYSKKQVDYKDDKYIKLLNKLIENSKKTSSVKCFEKIYLSREHVDVFTKKHTPKRWITNQKKVVKVILNNNYKKVRVDNLHIRDQINIINSAKKIITFIGAGCDNIAFTNKNCQFSILYAPNQEYWIKYYNYSNNLNGIECLKKDNNVLFNPRWGKDDQLNGPYKANIKKLKDLIN